LVATAFVCHHPGLRQAFPQGVVSHPIGGNPGRNAAAEPASSQQHHHDAERDNRGRCLEVPTLVQSDHTQSFSVGETVTEEVVDQTIVRHRNPDHPHAVSVIGTHLCTSAKSEPRPEV